MAKARLTAFVGMNSSGFSRGLRSIRRGMSRFNQNVIGPLGRLAKILAVGLAAGVVAATAAFTVLLNKMATFGDEMGKMAKRTGFSTDALQAWKLAAELSGTTIGVMEKGVKRMAGFLDDVGDELSTAVDAMDKLGLSVADFQGLSPEQAFNKFATAIAGIEDPLKRSAAAQDVFGKAGTAILPMLSDGVAGLQALKEEAANLGSIIPPESIKDAERFKDEVLRAQTAVKGALFEVVGNFLPAISDAIQKFQETFTDFRKSDSFDRIVTKIKEAAAVLVVAVRSILSSPDKFQLVGEIITTAFKNAGTFLGAVIKSAFDAPPIVKAFRNIMKGLKLWALSVKFIFARVAENIGRIFTQAVQALARITGSEKLTRFGQESQRRNEALGTKASDAIQLELDKVASSDREISDKDRFKEAAALIAQRNADLVRKIEASAGKPGDFAAAVADMVAKFSAGDGQRLGAAGAVAPVGLGGAAVAASREFSSLRGIGANILGGQALQKKVDPVVKINFDILKEQIKSRDFLKSIDERLAEEQLQEDGPAKF